MRRDTGKTIQQAGKLNQGASSLRTTKDEANSTNVVDSLEDDLEESDNDSDNDVDRLIEHFYDRFRKKLSREEAQELLDYSSKQD